LRVTRRLGPDREESLLAALRDIRALATGHRPDPSDRVANLTVADVRAYQAAEMGDDVMARRLVEDILARDPTDMVALGILRQTQTREGELSAAVQTIGRMLAIRESAALAVAQRQLQGRLIETEPGWLPRLTGPSESLPPRASNVVLHLMKETVPYLHNGSTIRSANTIRVQRDVGLEPVVVTTLGFPRCTGTLSIVPREIIDGVTNHRLDLGQGLPCDLPPDLALKEATWLTGRVVREERPAIVHAHSGYRGYETAMTGLAIRQRYGIPVVYEVRSFQEASWSNDPEHAESAEQFRRRYETEVRTMAAVDAVVTIAESMRTEIVARGIPADKVHVIPNGVDPVTFAPREADPEVRRRYGLDASRTVIGYVSSLDNAREGHEILLAGTARLLSAGRAVQCLIVGGGRRQRELEGLADKLGIRDSVVFSGAVPHEQIPAMYALFDVFVVPRLSDLASRFVTPLKPFEAMAAGRPLVVADLPALTEIAAPETRGLAFPSGDADGLAAAVGRLIDDPSLRASLAAEGRRWVLAERTWDRNGTRYRDLYDSLTVPGSAG
jgi:glycosyltransferase involved in cell wall biosynthesis